MLGCGGLNLAVLRKHDLQLDERKRALSGRWFWICLDTLKNSQRLIRLRSAEERRQRSGESIGFPSVVRHGDNGRVATNRGKRRLNVDRIGPHLPAATADLPVVESNRWSEPGCPCSNLFQRSVRIGSHRTIPLTKQALHDRLSF